MVDNIDKAINPAEELQIEKVGQEINLQGENPDGKFLEEDDGRGGSTRESFFWCKLSRIFR
jgi:hypothetical protein